MRSLKTSEAWADWSSKKANGELNKLFPEDRFVHDWYRFVLSFPPHLVRYYLQKFGITPDHQVIDPFCGTGTTVVECKKLGIPAVGIEAIPMAHFASLVKTDWSPDPEGLIRHSRRVAQAALTILESQGIEDDPIFRISSNRTKQLRTIPSEKFKLLLKDSISPVPLHKALTLLDCLNHHYDENYDKHERLSFAKVLVSFASNLKFGPEVGVGPPKPDNPVVGPWLAAVRTMADDLRKVQILEDAPSVVHHADSREMSGLLKPNSIDAIITSPPYPNEKDYTRTTRLESTLLGFIRDKADLRALKKTLVRSNTRGVYKGDDDDKWIYENSKIQRIAKDIERRRIQLSKTSGFERLYARVTKLYFGGMARHLATMREFLRPGAYLAYVVGDQASYLRIMIRTGHY